MSKQITILQQIADILSFKSDFSDLEFTLQNTDWESIVKVASQHYVLPAVYSRLKQKRLIPVLPKDLAEYLNKLTEINRNRNKKLLEESVAIANLLTKNGVKHTFLKGIALISGEYYADIGERMIGDIDILVSPKDAEKAFELLRQNGYSDIPLTLESKYFESKHLPRLVSEDNFGAVELHTRLFKTRREKKLTDDILNQSSKIGLFHIPNSKNLLSHNIFNFLINDDGFYYNSINLRNAYDCIVINNKNMVTIENKAEKRYILKLSYLFKDFEPEKLSVSQYASILPFILNLRLKYILSLRIRLAKIIKLVKVFFKRLVFLIINKNYRKDAYNDRHRIYKLIKSKYL